MFWRRSRHVQRLLFLAAPLSVSGELLFAPSRCWGPFSFIVYAYLLHSPLVAESHTQVSQVSHPVSVHTPRDRGAIIFFTNMGINDIIAIV